MNKKIAITTGSFAEYGQVPLSLLKEKNFTLAMNKFGRKLEKKEILLLCQGCIGIIAGTELYERDTLINLNGLKVISRCGVGIENIDLNTASELGIKVVNTPLGPTLAVAELTVGLILNALRNISVADRDIRKGIWKKRMGSLIKGKNVGIIGFGNIGRKVADLLVPFSANIAYFDINEKISAGPYLQKRFSDLLGWADIITLHCSGQNKGKEIIAAQEIEQMKDGVLLINTARGELLDEGALFEALKSGKISGAALDTFHHEPYNGKLKELDNVILTTHIGSYAKESRIEMEIEAVKNLLQCLEVEK